MVLTESGLAPRLPAMAGIAVICLDRVSTLVTDDGARPQELEPFEAAGVKVIVARVAAEHGVRSATA